MFHQLFRLINSGIERGFFVCYALLLKPHANVRYRQSLQKLALIELKSMLMAWEMENVEPEWQSIAGEPFLTFETDAMTDEAWREISRHSAACMAAEVLDGGLLKPVGFGTQRVEEELRALFPGVEILRMDADSTSRKNSHDDILSAFRRGEADILLGTQMIAKGLDFPNVTLVGILNADAAINMPDFRAAERAYQLFAQVAGRAGRAELPGEVLIQAYDAESPLLDSVMRGDFAAFAGDELKAREACGLPPFCHLASVTFTSPDLRLVGDWATMYAESLKKVRGLAVSDATPCALEKAEGRYRWQIVLRAPSAAPIAKAWRWISSVRPLPRAIRTALDIDAFNLI